MTISFNTPVLRGRYDTRYVSNQRFKFAIYSELPEIRVTIPHWYKDFTRWYMWGQQRDVFPGS